MAAPPAPPVPSKPNPATEPELLPVEGSFRAIAPSQMLDAPAFTARIIGTLKPGTELSVIGRVPSGEWYRARAAGLEGYVPAGAIREIGQIEEAEWQRVAKRPGVAALTTFLRQFPAGRHSAEAKEQLAALQRPPLSGARAVAARPAPAPRVYERSSTAAQFGRPDQPAAAPMRGAAEPIGRSRCSSISERGELGESISNADRNYLSNCR